MCGSHKAALSFIPDSTGEAAFMAVAGAVTKPVLFVGSVVAKPLLFAGQKAFNSSAKFLGRSGAKEAKVAANAATKTTTNPGKAEEVLFSHPAKLDFLPKGYLDGDLYPREKLISLVKYLEKREVNVIGTHGSPGFRAKNPITGRSEIHLPENPTVLQVKHELSHWLDCKALGVEKYSQLTRLEKEQMVLDRLQSKEKFWEQLTFKEQEFSTEYVARIAKGVENKKVEVPKNVN